MAEMSTGKKDKLKISPCSVDTDGNITVDKSREYEFFFNPSEFSHSYAIDYCKKEAIGQSSSDSKFSGIKPEKIKFTLLIDGTGVAATNSSPLDVKTQVKNISDIIYKYDGEKHEPNHVRVLWGSQIFFGRLESMSVENTLFKPNGVPLRAKLALSFTGFMSKEEEALRANRSSPDLSHLVEVKAGDTLPLLCNKIYKDSRYYIDVAKANNISNFRDIKPGQKLHFPPLR